MSSAPASQPKTHLACFWNARCVVHPPTHVRRAAHRHAGGTLRRQVFACASKASRSLPHVFRPRLGDTRRAREPKADQPAVSCQSFSSSSASSSIALRSDKQSQSVRHAPLALVGAQMLHSILAPLFCNSNMLPPEPTINTTATYSIYIDRILAPPV